MLIKDNFDGRSGFAAWCSIMLATNSCLRLYSVTGILVVVAVRRIALFARKYQMLGLIVLTSYFRRKCDVVLPAEMT